MICTKCKSELEENKKFCSNCGAKAQTKNNSKKGCLGFIVLFVIIAYFMSDFGNSFEGHTLKGGKIMYTTTDLNVRSKPSVKGKKIKTLSPNSKVITANKTQDGWVFIGDLDSVGLGFVSSKYLQNKSFSKDELEKMKLERDAANELYRLKNIIENQFSSWDGSHEKLVKYTKNNLKDPSSFEHIETKYWPPYTDNEIRVNANSLHQGVYTYRVRMRYTATNSFGAKVQGNILAEVSNDNGSVIQIISSE